LTTLEHALDFLNEALRRSLLNRQNMEAVLDSGTGSLGVDRGFALALGVNFLYRENL
jgi:hypothetical protein